MIDREILDIEYIPEKTIKEYAQPYLMGLDEFVYACNGNVVEKDYIPGAGDFIAVCPVVGKKFGSLLGSILGIGLSYLTGGIWANGIFGIKGMTFMSGLIASAVGYLGGQLVNHMFPQPEVDLPDTPQSTPSYGWGNLRAQTTQGGVYPITYGTMRTAGIEIAKHITADGEKQYLNLLLCGGIGPATAVEDIKINDNPIENYKGVQLDIRLGTNEQEVIPNFNDTYADQSLSYELVTPEKSEREWVVHQTEGNAAQGLEIVFELPNGLYHMNDEGELENAAVRVEAQYRQAGGSWAGWFCEDITDKKNTALRRVYRIDNLPPAQYEVRCKCLSKSGETTRDSTRIYWTQLSSIIYDDFCRPNKILVGIRALATEQLSGGDITVTWKQTVERVQVWNPHYKGYVERSARNPAWVCYDILHGCKKLRNIRTGQYEYIVFGGVQAQQLDYDAFERWADHCDVLGLNFEHIFDSAAGLWEALKIPESFGRGKVLMKGTKFSCVCDMPSIPVQLFTVGNILEEQFNKEYMSLTDRANAVEITFINREKGYQRDVITVYGPDWNQDNVMRNPTQITLTGCTSYEKAYAHGMYLLRINRLMIRTCTWQADIDAIACEIGDQVLVSHDVPEWGQSGRLLEAAGSQIILDRKVTMQPDKFYAVIIRYEDDLLLTKNVANQAVTQEIETDQITLKEPLTRLPKAYDIFAFGEVKKQAKPFIVVDISRTNDLTCKLSGIEYVPAVYEESLDAPIIDYAPGVTLYEVASVSVAEENFKQRDGTIVTNINISWTLPRNMNLSLIDSFAVYYTVDNGGTWQHLVDTKEMHAIMQNVRTSVTYIFKVCTISTLGVISKGVLSSPIYTSGKNGVFSDVEWLIAQRDEKDPTKVNLLWGWLNKPDIAGYLLYVNDELLTPAAIRDSRFQYTAKKSGSYEFKIKARDMSGNESERFAYAYLDIKIEPENVIDLSVEESFIYIDTGVNTTELDLKFKPNDLYYSFAEIYMVNDSPPLSMIETPVENLGGSWSSLENTGAWQSLGTAYDSLHITNIQRGRAYTFKIVAVNSAGIRGDFETSATISYVVEGNTMVPATPTGLSIEFTDTCTIKWDYSPDALLYELRYGGVKITTKDTFLQTLLENRRGILELYAINENGYSKAAKLEYYKPKPPCPKDVEIRELFQGMLLTTEDFNIYIKGISIHAYDGREEYVMFSDTNVFALKLLAGIYDIQVAFVDLFGEGEFSEPIEAVIKPYIDPELIKAESLSLEKMNEVIQDAIAKAQVSVSEDEYDKFKEDITHTVIQNKEDQDGQNKTMVSQINQSADKITSVITELNKPANLCGYTAIAQTQSAIQLRAEKNKLISLINVCPEAITIDGKYLHVTGTTKFDDSVIVNRMLAAQSVTADKIAAGAISADNIKAGTITADHIKAGTIDSASLDEALRNAISGIKVISGEWGYDGDFREAIVPGLHRINNGRVEFLTPIPEGYDRNKCHFMVCKTPNSYKNEANLELLEDGWVYSGREIREGTKCAKYRYITIGTR